MDNLPMCWCVSCKNMCVFMCAPACVSLYRIFTFSTCACLQITSTHLYLCKGLYSNSSRATPVAVARTERIQKLS